MATDQPLRIEDKLYQNRYLVDAGRAHIKVREHDVPTPPLLALLTACPARCYELNDKGQVEITVDGCVECGTCRVIGEPSGDIEWSYPRGGTASSSSSAEAQPGLGKAGPRRFCGGRAPAFTAAPSPATAPFESIGWAGLRDLGPPSFVASVAASLPWASRKISTRALQPIALPSE